MPSESEFQINNNNKKCVNISTCEYHVRYSYHLFFLWNSILTGGLISYLAILQIHLLLFLAIVLSHFFFRFSPPPQMTCCALSIWKTQVNWFFVLSCKISADLLQPNPSRANRSRLCAASVPRTDLSITEPQAVSHHLCVSCCKVTRTHSPLPTCIPSARINRHHKRTSRYGKSRNLEPDKTNTDSQSLKVLTYIVCFVFK